MLQRWIQMLYRAMPGWMRRLVPLEKEDHNIVRRLGKNFSIGVGGSVVGMLAGLGRTAILTKSLSVAGYGNLLIVLNLFGFLNQLLSIRVGDAIYRFFPRFEEKNDQAALRGLFSLSFSLCLLIGLLVGGGMVIFAPWIAEYFYKDLNLVPAMRAYAGASVLLAFQMFYTSILRLEDRFAAVVVPGMMADVTQLVSLLLYVLLADSYHLVEVVGLLAIGVVVRTVPPLIMAIRAVYPTLRHETGASFIESLRPYRRELTSTLVQTNLMGYLKVFSNPGDLFVLGIFATPAQVGYYGLATRMLQPLTSVLQRNVQTATQPEIVSLWAKRKFRQMKRLMSQFVKIGAAVGGVALAAGLLLARSVVLLVAKADYLAALPAFYTLLVYRYTEIVYIAFYPASVAMNMLGRRNLIFLASIALTGALVLSGAVNALNMALIQLAGSIGFRLFHDWPLYQRLQKHSREETHSV